MNDWSFAALGAWVPLLVILGAAAAALAFALVMEAIVGSGPVPTARHALTAARRRHPAIRAR
jgi:hypothetical protein